MKIFYILSFIFIMQIASAQELRDMIEQVSDRYNAGDCTKTLSLADEIFAANPDELSSHTEIVYVLSYYAGICARQLNEHESTVAHLSRALKNNPTKEQLPAILTMLANAEEALGQDRLARQHYTQAASILPDGDDKASLHYLLAEIYRRSGIYQEALLFCESATKMAKQTGNVQIELACLSSSGEVYYDEEDYPRAIRTFTQGITLARSEKLPLEMANNHTGLGIVYEALDRYDFARTNYNEAIHLYLLTLNFANIPMLSERLAKLPATVDEAATCLPLYEELVKELGVIDAEMAIYAQRLLGAYYSKADKADAAKDTYTLVLAAAKEAALPEMAFEAASRIAGIQYEKEDVDAALATLDEAAKYHAAQNPPRYLADVYGFQGDIFLEMKSPAMAQYNYRKAYDSAISPEEKNKYLRLIASIDPTETGGGI